MTTASHAVAAARADLAGASLTAPVAGVVGSIGLRVGGRATTSSGIVILPAGSAAVTIDVPLTTLPRLSVGQAAKVTPAGATTAVDGSVSAIGLLPASTSGSTPTYPVTVTVPHAGQSLSPGSRADVAVVVSAATDVVTVPASAVTPLASTGGTTSALVQVLSAGVATPTRVTLGAVGGGSAQVTTGLTAGQVVVLADTSAAVPSGSAGSLLRGVGGGALGGAGGFGGAGGLGGAGGPGGTTGRGGFGGNGAAGGGARAG